MFLREPYPVDATALVDTHLVFVPAAAVDRILLANGEQASEVRDRALLLLHLGRPSEAARDLRRYLKIEPLAPDRAVMEQLLERATESS